MKTGFSDLMAGARRSPRCCNAFHDTGSSYLWELLDPVSNGAMGYPRFRYSYASRLPESVGRPVLFEGISCFRFRCDLIAH
jgi:hypothetical protein